MFKKILTSSLLALISIGGILIQSTTWVYAISEAEFNAADAAQLKQQWISDAQISQIQSQEKSTWNSQDAKMKEMLNNLVAWINIILNILTIIVTPAIMLASWLMSPDWTAGDIFGIRPILHDLWITVSNITYLVYAVLLIFIAVATIFNSEHYGYKSMLPKLALGIILVPLTWWGVQFTISVATYATAAAVSVPAESLKKYTDSSAWWKTPIIPINMEYKNGKFYSGENDLSKDWSVTELCKTAGKCATPEKVTTDAGWLFSPLLIYSFGVFKIQNVQKIDTKMDVVTSIMHIIHQWIIGALMFIIYGLLVMALIFMLIMRAMKLWFYAIFSPLFTIKYMLGDKWFGEADKDGSFKITEFIGLAFVPAVVSLALSFGLIIISALYTPLGNKWVENPNNKCESSGECTIIIANNPKNTIVSKTIETKQWNKSSTTVTIGGIGYTFEWAVEWWEKVVPGVKSALSATGNLFGTIIIDIIALVFIWLAFMAGKWVSKAAGKAIEPFEQMGKKIWDLGMSLPKYTPLPVPGGLSMAGMQKVAGMPEQFLSQRAINETKWIEDRMGKMFGVNLPYWSGEQHKVHEILARDKLTREDFNIAQQTIQSARNKGWIDPNGTNGQMAIEDATKVLQKAVKDWVTLNIPWLTDAEITAATTPEQKNAIVASWLAWKRLHGTEATNFLKQKGETPDSGPWNQVPNNPTTNNTFNITTGWDGKYSLKSGQLDTEKISKDELLKRIENNIHLLKDVSEETMRSQLTNIGTTDTQIQGILKKLEEAKKSK